MRLPPCCVVDISAMSTPVGILCSAFAISRQRTPKGSPYLMCPAICLRRSPILLCTEAHSTVPPHLENQLILFKRHLSPTQARGGGASLCP